MKRRVVINSVYREPMLVEIWQQVSNEEHLGVSNRKQKQVDLDGSRPLYLVCISRYTKLELGSQESTRVVPRIHSVPMRIRDGVFLLSKCLFNIT